MFCEESLGKINKYDLELFRWVGPQILSLERDDNFGTSEHFSGQKKKSSLISLKSRPLNFHAITVCTHAYLSRDISGCC